MDRIKKNVLKDLRFYGTNAMRYWKTGYHEEANINRIRVNVIINILRRRNDD